MSYPQIIENHNEDIIEIENDILSIETRFQQFQENLVNLIYPVGSIYMSTNNVSPATFLGGTWESVKDTFLLCSGDTYTAGSSGGEATHTLTVSETPAHTHTRGTMNITGGTGMHVTRNGGQYSQGAFYWGNHTCGGLTGNAQSYGQMFDASRSWTGATSSVGGSQSHNNMPPYLTVYCWKRIS